MDFNYSSIKVIIKTINQHNTLKLNKIYHNGWIHFRILCVHLHVLRSDGIKFNVDPASDEQGDEGETADVHLPTINPKRCNVHKVATLKTTHIAGKL